MSLNPNEVLQVNCGQRSFKHHPSLTRCNQCSVDQGVIAGNKTIVDVTSAAVETRQNKTEIDWSLLPTLEDVKRLGMDKIKALLDDLGVKGGGTLDERSNRLWSLKDMKVEQYPANVLKKKRVVWLNEYFEGSGREKL